MSLAALALEIAEKAHAGVSDKAGFPYILHPTRVGAHFEDEDAQVVGFLHDVLEDTDMQESELRQIFTKTQVDAIVALTRPDDETYHDFIERCAQNPLARRVKVQDIRDNLRPGYTKDSLRRRYVAALIRLLNESDDDA